MDRHPGGEENTGYMIELSGLKAPARWLDMGAGAGDTLRLLRSLGYEAEGIDLEPRGEDVTMGDYLSAAYADESFDGIISQCSFYLSGDAPKAVREAARMLRKGGAFALADLTADAEKLLSHLTEAGFKLKHMEDMTAQWREYYLEALWRDESGCIPTGKGLKYLLLICERL